MLSNGILGVHSLLRWLVIILLLVNISKNFLQKELPFTISDRNWVLRLVVVMHINVLIGLYQYFFGAKGFALIKEYTTQIVMKTPIMRFWVVEHISGMILAAILITVASIVSKSNTTQHTTKHKRVMWLCIVSLLIICAVIPWPFRPGFSDMPLFRGLY
jgi:hypothetical protein